MRISERVQKEYDRLVGYRRDLHRIPEEAFEEKKTSEYIWRVLEKLRPDRLERLCGTGIKAVFGEDLPAQAVAVRADMDALPVTEQTGLSFASRHKGCMHACGHDGHMAACLVTAGIVSRVRSELKRPFTFVFQPAEETTGGAEPMIRAGVLENPKVGSIYGMHLWPYIGQGLAGLHPGPVMASMSDINIRIEGTSCHGARPQDGSDAIVAACQFITALQSIVSRNVNPYEAAIVSFGRIAGGDARNIVCDAVDLEGTLRVFDPATRDLVRTRMHEMLKGLESMFRVKTARHETMSYPAVINAPELVREARDRFSEDERTDPEPVMISEDFSFYQQHVPGLFAFIGTNAPGHDEPLHSARFTFDEKVLLSCVEYFVRVTDCP